MGCGQRAIYREEHRRFVDYVLPLGSKAERLGKAWENCMAASPGSCGVGLRTWQRTNSRDMNSCGTLLVEEISSTV